jgi:hypothetical protein
MFLARYVGDCTYKFLNNIGIVRKRNERDPQKKKDEEEKMMARAHKNSCRRIFTMRSGSSITRWYMVLFNTVSLKSQMLHMLSTRTPIQSISHLTHSLRARATSPTGLRRLLDILPVQCFVSVLYEYYHSSLSVRVLVPTSILVVSLEEKDTAETVTKSTHARI